MKQVTALRHTGYRIWLSGLLVAILAWSWSLVGYAATSAYQVTHKVTNSWGSGYQGEIMLKNTGATELRDWRLEFDYPQNINSI